MSDTLEQVVEMALRLSAVERAHLLERIASTLKQELTEANKQPRKSLYGLCADLGSAPSAEDIDEARREIWGNFPREDIA